MTKGSLYSTGTNVPSAGAALVLASFQLDGSDDPIPSSCVGCIVLGGREDLQFLLLLLNCRLLFVNLCNSWPIHSGATVPVPGTGGSALLGPFVVVKEKSPYRQKIIIGQPCKFSKVHLLPSPPVVERKTVH